MKKKLEESADVEDVRREEMSRGRRPVSLEARRQRQELLHDLRKLLEIGTESDFVAAMRALGFEADSSRWDDLIGFGASTDLSDGLVKGMQLLGAVGGR